MKALETSTLMRTPHPQAPLCQTQPVVVGHIIFIIFI